MKILTIAAILVTLVGSYSFADKYESCSTKKDDIEAYNKCLNQIMETEGEGDNEVVDQASTKSPPKRNTPTSICTYGLMIKGMNEGDQVMSKSNLNTCVKDIKWSRSEKGHGPSISEKCILEKWDNPKAVNTCHKLYFECADDIYKSPRSTKESMTQKVCIDKNNNKLNSKIDTEVNQHEKNNEQASKNEEMLQLQRQQLELMQRQNRVQTMNAVSQSFDYIKPIQMPMLKTNPSTQTNCNPNGIGGFNCTSY